MVAEQEKKKLKVIVLIQRRILTVVINSTRQGDEFNEFFLMLQI